MSLDFFHFKKKILGENRDNVIMSLQFRTVVKYVIVKVAS